MKPGLLVSDRLSSWPCASRSRSSWKSLNRFVVGGSFNCMWWETISVLVPLIRVQKRLMTGRLNNWPLFHTTHTVKTQHVTKIRSRHCGELNWRSHLWTTDPVPLVMDLHITHDRFGSRSDPSLNGHLPYPNYIDNSLNESVTDKIRKYHTEYNNNPPPSVSFMSSIPSTSGRLHSKLIRLLFLQAHRETDRFFADSVLHQKK
jgi:hypothetical protein